MKNKTLQLKQIVLIFFLSLLSYTTYSQNGLKIGHFFKEYSKKNNTTIVELSKDILGKYNISYYKAISFKASATDKKKITTYLKEDKKKSRKIKEVINNQIITTGYYQLKEKSSNGLNRYILFKLNTTNTLTLIYLEGKLNTNALLTFINKAGKRKN